jgi:hypothetical protein
MIPARQYHYPTQLRLMDGFEQLMVNELSGTNLWELNGVFPFCLPERLNQEARSNTTAFQR